MYMLNMNKYCFDVAEENMSPAPSVNSLVESSSKDLRILVITTKFLVPSTSLH